MQVKMGHVPSVVYAPVYVGVERGYFAERGLDVDLIITRGGDTAFQVAGGTLQFAGGSPDTAFFNGLKRGLPLMGIAPLAHNPMDKSAEPLMVRKDVKDSGEVKQIGDLKGRKVANLVPGGITEYLLALNLRSGGLTMDDIDVISPMGFPQMVDAFTTKVVDAALIGEPFATMAIRKGVGAILQETSDLGEQILWIQTNREFAERNPAVVTNFLIAYLKAARDLNSEGFKGSEIMKILTKYTRVPEEVIQAAAMPVVPPNGEFNLESIMSQQRYHLTRGKMTYNDPIPVKEFTNQTYMRQAIDFLGSYKK
jgi:NitT/TauT family transport system substrate-binding protein